MAKFASFLSAMALASFPNTAVSQPGGRRCHGTVGVQCGNLLLGQIAVCHPRLDGNVLCMVNAGSWRHDECCARQPNGAPGMMCAGGGEAGTIRDSV